MPDREAREGLFFVNFKRKAGSAVLFYVNAKQFCDHLFLFNNATLEEGEVNQFTDFPCPFAQAFE